MNSQTYRNLIKLFERWPLDSTKSGRDFGEFIRKQVSESFKQGNEQKLKLDNWENIFQSLNKISLNIYKQTFATRKNSSSLGLTEEECRILLSKEFTEAVRESDKGTFEKFSALIKSKKIKSNKLQ